MAFLTFLISSLSSSQFALTNITVFKVSVLLPICRVLLGTDKLYLSIVYIHHVFFPLSLCLPHDILILIFGSHTGQSSPLKSEALSGYSDFYFKENWFLEYQLSLHCRGAQKCFVSVTEKLGSPWASLLPWTELMCAISFKSVASFFTPCV